MPPIENGAGNEDRGEGSREHAVNKDLAVETDIAGTEGPEGDSAEEDRGGGQDRTGKRAIDGEVNHVFQRATRVMPELFADSVKDNDRVIHRVTDDEQDGGNQARVKLSAKEDE